MIVGARGPVEAGASVVARLESATSQTLLSRDLQWLWCDTDYSGQMVPADRWTMWRTSRHSRLDREATQVDVLQGRMLAVVGMGRGTGPARFLRSRRRGPSGHRGGSDSPTTASCLPAPGTGAAGTGAVRRLAPTQISSGCSAAGRTRTEARWPRKLRMEALKTHVIWTRTKQRAPRRSWAADAASSLAARGGILSAWRTRALIVFAVATVLSVFFAFTHEGEEPHPSCFLLGYMICFTFPAAGWCC